MSDLNEALIQFQKDQEALLEVLKKVVDTVTVNSELRGKLIESKQGMDEFFEKFKEYQYQRFGGLLPK